MARTKTEPVPVMAVPMLPSDVVDVPTLAAGVETAELPSVPAERPHDAPATAPDVFQRLATKAEADRLKAEAKFSDMVCQLALRLARSEIVSEADITNVLAVTGRTLTELQIATDRQRKIDRLESLIADLPEATAAYQVARFALTALEADHKVRRQQIEDEHKLARRVAATARMRKDRAEESRSKLYMLCPERPVA